MSVPSSRPYNMGSAPARGRRGTVACVLFLCVLGGDALQTSFDHLRRGERVRPPVAPGTLQFLLTDLSLSLRSEAAAPPQIPSTPPPRHRRRHADANANAATTAAESLWPWQLGLLGITASWGANFAVTSYALNALGGSPIDGELFIASRFVVAAALLLPFLASASSAAAVRAGVQVGGLCAFGYATQATALGMGTSPGTAAFICSLQSARARAYFFASVASPPHAAVLTRS